MPRLRLDPLSPSGVSVANDAPARTVTNAVPRLQTLDDLQDVVISGTPTDNQALAYDTATGKWIPQTVSGGAGGVNETNLTASRTATSVTVASDTGTDAVLAAADTANAGVMTAGDKTKLDGIATGATANDTDANLKDRTNHTGTQTASTISDFTTAAAAAAPIQSVVAGTNVTVDTTDPYNPVINATGGGSGSSAWGGITGTLSDQTDLQTALDTKLEETNGQTTLELTPSASMFGSSLKMSDLSGVASVTTPDTLTITANTGDDGNGMWNTYFEMSPTRFGVEINDQTNWGNAAKMYVHRDDTDLANDGVEVSSGGTAYSALLRTSNLTAKRSLELPDEAGTLATENYVDTAVAGVGGGGGSGDVVGPAGVPSDNLLAVFNGTTGKLLKAGGLDSAATPTLQDDSWLRAPRFRATTIQEAETDAGVTVDGVVLKDSGATLAGPLAVQYGYPSFRVKNTDATQYAGAGFFLTNTASTMGNQAGVTHYMGINDAGATQGFYAIDKTDTTGGGTGHLMLFDYATNTAQIYQPLTVGTSGSTLGTIKLAGNTSGTTTLTPAAAASGTLTLPSATDTLVGRDTTDTLTNKTLSTPALSGIVTGTYTLGGTPTFPSTVVSTTGTQTLTNKTLTNPLFTSASYIGDSNGNELIKFPATVAGAVNELTVSNAATGGTPSIEATGDDASISVQLTPKGSGVVRAEATNGMEIKGSASAPTTPSATYGKITMAGSSSVRPRFINSSGSIESIVTSGSSSNELPTGSVVQVVSSGYSAVATGTTTIPLDDTIPQITEGTEFMTASITPKSTSNLLKIEISFYGSHSVAGTDTVVALFQDSTANALSATSVLQPTANGRNMVYLQYTMTAGTTSATTFRVRAGGHNAGTLTFNGIAGTRSFGAINKSFITITEIKA